MEKDLWGRVQAQNAILRQSAREGWSIEKTQAAINAALIGFWSI